MIASRFLLPIAGFALGAALPLAATVHPHPLFCDHAVLQQGREVPVWGTADDGEQVSVEIAGRSATATTVAGRWLVRLPELPVGGPYTLTIRGTNTVVLDDVLVGEVWLCGGQSNMERQLGPREGQKPLVGWERTAATAALPQLRHFGVAQKLSAVPLAGVGGSWQVSSPETAPEFTAVGFYFGRALQRARNVPVGLIHASWGGTPAEAWTSAETMRRIPGTDAVLELLQVQAQDPERAATEYRAKLEQWCAQHDAGSAPAAPWSAPEVPAAGWTSSTLPGFWEQADHLGFDGLVWYRKEFTLTAEQAAGAATLDVGRVDDVDTTWVNGVEVGSTAGWKVDRSYAVPAGVLRAGRNVVAVRVLDSGGGGGIWGEAAGLALHPVAGDAVSLAGEWSRRVSASVQQTGLPPVAPSTGSNVPTVLYNGMIAPLLPYAVRGAIWYQGEANNPFPQEYRKLLPLTIADWRRSFGQGEFPFLFVQIAPHEEMTPELREAQLQIWQETKNTAMVVTTDCGDAEDIHPADKEPVGERLALAARAVAYGEAIEYSGPVYAGAEFSGAAATIRFTHVGGGLVAPGGVLKGFTLAGADGVFHPAAAKIAGDKIVVTSAEVPAPKAVRYGWANVPDCNLFNTLGLPASPFRSDAP